MYLWEKSEANLRGEQLYVASAVVQSGHVDTDGGESVIQIFAEFTLAHRPRIGPRWWPPPHVCWFSVRWNFPP